MSDYLGVATNMFVTSSRTDFNAEVAESAEEGWTLRVLRDLCVSSFFQFPLVAAAAVCHCLFTSSHAATILRR